MKKILSLVLVLSMVLGSFGFAFAAEEVVPDSVKRVHAAGLFGVGGLELDRIATRAELATLVLRLHGYEDAEIEALKTASNFSDVAATSWYAPYVGLAVQEGLFTGDTGANTFRPLENAKYAELLVVILRALGYGEDLAGLAWPNGYVLKAAEVGIDVDLTKDANSTVSRLVVGATIDKALDLEVKGGEETLGQKLGLEGFEPVEPEPEELEIVGVSTDNLKQVVVEFNMDVTNNEHVENVDNYKLEDTKGKLISKVEDVQIEENIVTLTLEKATANQSNRVLVIGKEVLGKEVEEDITFDDFTIPVVEEAEVIGKRTILVKFSEPVKTEKDDKLNRSAFTVKDENNKTIYVRDAVAKKNDKEALVTLRSDLKDGQVITLTVDSIKDYAEYKVAKTEFELEVIEDDSEIEVIGFRKANEEGITLIFNKNIEFKETSEKRNAEKVYHTNTKNKATKVTADGNELKVEFTEENIMPTGTVYIFIDGDTLRDYWGNLNKKTIRYEAEITPDMKVPTIDKIEADSNGRTIKVTFDKSLDEKSAKDEDNYEVVFENSGKEASKISSVSYKEKVVTINLRSKLDPGKYILEIDGVEDFLGNTEVSTSKSFSVKGNELEEDEIDVSAYKNGNEYTILVDYNRAMDTEDERYSVLEPANYSVWFDGRLRSLEYIGDEDDYYVEIDLADEDAEVVEIVIEENIKEKKLFKGGPERLYISRVKDANGVYMSGLASTDGLALNLNDNKTFGIKKFEAVDKETLKVTFTKEVDELDMDDFKFQYKSGTDIKTISSREYDYDLDRDVLTILFDDEVLTTDARFGKDSDTVVELAYLPYNDKTATKTAYGDVLVIDYKGSSTGYVVKDKIAPEVANISAKSQSVGEKESLVEVTIKFTEEMNPKTFSTKSFSVDDAELVVPTNGTWHNWTDGTTLTFTVKYDSKVDVGDYISVSYDQAVEDMAGNELDFEDAEDSAEVKR